LRHAVATASHPSMETQRTKCRWGDAGRGGVAGLDPPASAVRRQEALPWPPTARLRPLSPGQEVSIYHPLV
jgi:hypothetical protein